MSVLKGTGDSRITSMVNERKLITPGVAETAKSSIERITKWPGRDRPGQRFRVADIPGFSVVNSFFFRPFAFFRPTDDFQGINGESAAMILQFVSSHKEQKKKIEKVWKGISRNAYSP
jgi:hypothetical protein